MQRVESVKKPVTVMRPEEASAKRAGAGTSSPRFSRCRNHDHGQKIADREPFDRRRERCDDLAWLMSIAAEHHPDDQSREAEEREDIREHWVVEKVRPQWRGLRLGEPPKPQDECHYDERDADSLLTKSHTVFSLLFRGMWTSRRRGTRLLRAKLGAHSRFAHYRFGNTLSSGFWRLFSHKLKLTYNRRDFGGVDVV